MFGNHSGAAHYKYDEEVPTAYEQLSDPADNLMPANKVGDFMDNNHITYTSPTFDLAGASITFDLGYAQMQMTLKQVTVVFQEELVHTELVKKLV